MRAFTHPAGLLVKLPLWEKPPRRAPRLLDVFSFPGGTRCEERRANRQKAERGSAARRWRDGEKDKEHVQQKSVGFTRAEGERGVAVTMNSGLERQGTPQQGGAEGSAASSSESARLCERQHKERAFKQPTAKEEGSAEW